MIEASARDAAVVWVAIALGLLRIERPSRLGEHTADRGEELLSRDVRGLYRALHDTAKSRLCVCDDTKESGPGGLGGGGGGGLGGHRDDINKWKRSRCFG